MEAKNGSCRFYANSTATAKSTRAGAACKLLKFKENIQTGGMNVEAVETKIDDCRYGSTSVPLAQASVVVYRDQIRRGHAGIEPAVQHTEGIKARIEDAMRISESGYEERAGRQAPQNRQQSSDSPAKAAEMPRIATAPSACPLGSALGSGVLRPTHCARSTQCRPPLYSMLPVSPWKPCAACFSSQRITRPSL